MRGGFLVVMRCQHNREDRHIGIELHAHQRIDHRGGHKIMPVNPAIHHKGAADDCIGPARNGAFGSQRNFKGTRHADYLYRKGIAHRRHKPGQCFIHNVAMPVGGDKAYVFLDGIFHLESPKLRTPRQMKPRATWPATPLSFIRTLTVGPGITPGLLTPGIWPGRSRAIPPVGNFTPP